ncbi:MAG: hypothetical protein U1E77_04720 [Inhella sp.]
MRIGSKALRGRSLLFAATLAAGALQAQAAPPACALKPADLSRVLGVSFSEGKPEDAGGMGTGCTYKASGGSMKAGTEVSLFLHITSAGGPPDMMRKMMNPGKTRFQSVAGDPDRAVIVQHAPDVPTFPDVSYDRGGYLIGLRLSGTFYKDLAQRQSAKAEWDAKLLKLPRLP